MHEDNILAAIGSTEPSSFSEFCSGLKDCPTKGDKAGWHEVFSTLDTLERSGFVTVERYKGEIASLILTKAGANRIRERLDKGRGLLAGL